MRIRGRVELRRVASVAGRRDDDHALRARIRQRIGELDARARPAEAEVDHLRAAVDGPHDPRCDQRVVAGSLRVERLDRHDETTPADSGSADVVVRARRDDAGHRGPVSVVVGRIGVVTDEVPARHERAAQIRMVCVHAGVDDGDDDLARALRDVPGLGEACDTQAVLLWPVRVVWARIECLCDRFLRRARHRCRRLQRCQHLGSLLGLHPDEVGVDLGNGLHERPAGIGDHLRHPRACDPGLEGHGHTVGVVAHDGRAPRRRLLFAGRARRLRACRRFPSSGRTLYIAATNVEDRIYDHAHVGAGASPCGQGKSDHHPQRQPTGHRSEPHSR